MEQEDWEEERWGDEGGCSRRTGGTLTTDKQQKENQKKHKQRTEQGQPVVMAGCNEEAVSKHSEKREKQESNTHNNANAKRGEKAGNG